MSSRMRYLITCHRGSFASVYGNSKALTTSVREWKKLVVRRGRHARRTVRNRLHHWRLSLLDSLS